MGTLVSDLTDEQRVVATRPPEARLLVTAGPGTGKTHTLVARLASLVVDHGLAPADELLVLSFTRAAVRNVRERAARHDDRIVPARILTFDAFATRLLAAADPDGGWVHRGYEGRILAATRLLRDEPEALEEVGWYRHVLVDEVQDLVGDRDRLVRALLPAIDGGFTLLGDPAQGIYGYRLEDPEARRVGSAALYSWVRETWGDDLGEHVLTHNHRAETEEAGAALWAGDFLGAADLADVDAAEVHADLHATVLKLRHLGDHRHVLPLLGRPPGPTAVLCRTNGEALLVSRELHRCGVAHDLRRSASDRAVVPEIGAVLSEVSAAVLSRTAFDAACARLPAGGRPDADAVWTLLRRLDPSPGPGVDLGRVAEWIRTGRVPDEAVHTGTDRLVVSSVHRAKGLEFDDVHLVTPPRRRYPEGQVEVAEEARVLYVALTRARRGVTVMEGPDTSGYDTRAGTDGRWSMRRYGRGGSSRWRVCEIEVRGDDVHRFDPAGGLALEDVAPVEAQRYIRERVRRGDAVVLERVGDPDPDDVARYAVVHNGHAVGVTSEDFGRSLHDVLKVSTTWRVRWPVRIENVHVELVDTVAGRPGTGSRAGLGSSDVYNRVRVAGMGSLRFRRASDLEDGERR